MARWNEVLVVDQQNIYGYNGSNYRPINIDSYSRAVLMMEFEHHEIHEGDHYAINGVQDLAINNVLDIQWTTPNTTKWCHLLWRISTESETAWTVYEGATITLAGSAVTPINNNRNSANTSAQTIKFHVNATLEAANADTGVGSATVMATGISGAGKDAGVASRENEIILKQNTIYCFRAVATAAGYIDYVMNWYEHTNETA